MILVIDSFGSKRINQKTIKRITTLIPNTCFSHYLLKYLKDAIKKFVVVLTNE